MDLFKKVDKDLLKIINAYLSDVEEAEKYLKNVTFVIPPLQTNADYSTNAAMVFAKAKRKSPAIIATELAEEIKKLDYVKDVETINGYINIIFTENTWEEFLSGIIADGKHYGDGEKRDKVLLEFISANPTGPLHVGHCRGAILGLALANLKKKAGYDVTKEYYVNDYGVQINTLLKSVQFRYEQEFGNHVNENVPEGCYPGDYLVKYAKKLAKESGNKYVGLSEEEFYAQLKNQVVEAMMDIIRDDLALLGLKFDSFVSETDIVESGAIEASIEKLASKSKIVEDEDGNKEELGYVYKGILDVPLGGKDNAEEDDVNSSKLPQTLFRSTLFGDDRDRVIIRADGRGTYFASDIAYHADKVKRGYNNLINIFGADHGGYVKRITAAVDAVSDGTASLDVQLCQMVNLEKNGVPFKMSKRKGTFVLLSDVAKEVNVNELKLFMLSKSPDTQMTFDLVKVKEESKDNIVYYIQYAYARTFSVLRKFKEVFGYDYKFDAKDLSGFVLNCPQLIKEIIVFLAKFPYVIRSSAEKNLPNQVVDYLYNLASKFHSLWGTSIRMINAENEEYTKSVMAFVTAVQTVVENSLDCLGVEAKKVMQRDEK